MANDLKTVAEVVAINGQDFDSGEFSDILNDAPALAAMGVKESSNGKDHKYVKKTAPPIVGFIGNGVGRDFSKLTSIPVTDSLEAIDGSVMMPKVAADASDDREGTIQTEIMEHLKASMFEWEKQIFNGTNNSPTGFNGFADVVSDTSNTQFVNGGGTGGGSVYTSVYMVRVNGSINGIAPVMNYNLEVGETIVQNYDPGDGKNAPHYYTPVFGYTGLQIGNNYSIVRVGNLDGSDSLTDDLLSQALEKFPAGSAPTHIFMNRAQRGALQRSRTTYSPTGQPAVLPSEYEGLPIVITEALGQLEDEVVAP
jgi:hypothetical protein